jgi:hypothetical protein
MDPPEVNRMIRGLEIGDVEVKTELHNDTGAKRV